MATPPPPSSPGPGPIYTSPSNFATPSPPIPSAAPRKRNPLVLVIAGVVGLCIIGTVVGSINSVVNGPSIRATETAETAVQSTAQVVQAATQAIVKAATQTAAPGATAQAVTQAIAAATAAGPATAQALAAANVAATQQSQQATATVLAQPTVTPLPSYGSTVEGRGWVVSLAKSEARATIVWSEVGNAYKASGKFWVFWIDAKNTQNASRSLNDDYDFELVDDHDAHYPEEASANSFALSEFARLQGRDRLDAGVTPRAVTHPLLVFDVAADALPAQLLLKGKGLFSSDQIVFNVTPKKKK